MKIDDKNNFKHYQAVSCKMHSELELAIMHGQTLKIHYFNEAHKKEIIINITPQDIVTRRSKNRHNGQYVSGEYLLGIDNKGNTFEIRLDFVRSYSLISS